MWTCLKLGDTKIIFLSVSCTIVLIIFDLNLIYAPMVNVRHILRNDIRHPSDGMRRPPAMQRPE